VSPAAGGRNARGARRPLVAAAIALLAPLAGFILVARSSYEPSRQYRHVPDSGPVSVALEAGASLTSPGNPVLSRFSIFECRPAGPHDGPYSLAFVEFDDQGFLWDPRQMTTLEEHITTIGAGRGVIMVVFVHGWNHSANPADNNVACFQQVVQAVSLLEHAVTRDNPRAVVGVFCGWRGSVYRSPSINKMLTFWDRLSASNRVGERGDMLRVLSMLSHLKHTLPGSHPNILAITGHSMGARALFEAVGANLKESLARASLGESMIGGFGDLVVLVNPAFVAAEYRLIDEIAREPGIQAAANAEPSLVLISSEADQVMRRLYPIGEYIRPFGQSANPSRDRQMLFQTAANYAPFVTHRLRVVEGAIPNPSSGGKTSPCGCRFVCAEELPIVRGVLDHPEQRELFRYSDIRVLSPSHSGGDSLIYRLALENLREHRLPAIVIQADGPILPEHGESYTPALIEFLVRLVNTKVSSVPARADRSASASP